MEYKYENVETVELKQNLEVYKHDENIEITETLMLRKGVKGEVESMGCSSVDNFVIRYDIRFMQDGDEIIASIPESRMEELFILS